MHHRRGRRGAQHRARAAGDTVAVFGRVRRPAVNVIQGAAHRRRPRRIIAVDVVATRSSSGRTAVRRQPTCLDVNVPRRRRRGCDAAARAHRRLRRRLRRLRGDRRTPTCHPPGVPVGARRGGQAVRWWAWPVRRRRSALPACLLYSSRGRALALVGSLHGSALMSRDVPRLLALYRSRLRSEARTSWCRASCKPRRVNAGLEALESRRRSAHGRDSRPLTFLLAHRGCRGAVLRWRLRHRGWRWRSSARRWCSWPRRWAQRSLSVAED